MISDIHFGAISLLPTCQKLLVFHISISQFQKGRLHISNEEEMLGHINQCNIWKEYFLKWIMSDLSKKKTPKKGHKFKSPLAVLGIATFPWLLSLPAPGLFGAHSAWIQSISIFYWRNKTVHSFTNLSLKWQIKGKVCMSWSTPF